MAPKTLAILSTTFAAALLLSGCASGDAADDGVLQIETSPETEVDADAGDSGDGADAGAIGGEGTAVLGGTLYRYTIVCTRAPGEVDLGMSGSSSFGPLNAGFGVGDPDDNILLSIEGVTWRADSSGDYGEISVLDVDVDAGTAIGSAVFETESGETAAATFDFRCD